MFDKQKPISLVKSLYQQRYRKNQKRIKLFMENTHQNPENTPQETIAVSTQDTPTQETINLNATQKSGVKLELVIAFLSLFISVFTFVITAFQTNIMQKQQKASVWAYLEANIGISRDGFYIEVHNKGVGASIVKDVTYFLNDKKFKSFEELAKYAMQDTKFSYEFYSTNPINKKVFAPTEKIKVFSINEMKYASKMVKNKINVEIIYTNIYGDESIFRNF